MSVGSWIRNSIRLGRSSSNKRGDLMCYEQNQTEFSKRENDIK